MQIVLKYCVVLTNTITGFKMIVAQKTLTLTEVATYLGIEKRTLYNMIEDGRFKVAPIKDLNPRRWNIEAIDAWRLG